MALTLGDRIQETTTTTGTGTITLAGAVSGYQSFAAVGNGNTTYYTITSGTAWEVGIGTYSSTGPTLARTTILASSNSNTAITLSGTSTVFATYPAERAVSTDNTATLTNKTLSLEAYSAATSVTAGTNAIGQSPLTNDLNIITTTASNPSGVTLPAAFVGARIVVVNKGTNPINVYPATGSAINGGFVNTAVSCAVDATITFIASSTATWYTVGGYTTTGSGFVPVSEGGTGSTTTPANGQLLIGNGTGYSVANITAGSAITVTNGSGTISISSSGGGGAFTLVNSYSASIYKGSPPFSLASLGTLTSGAGRFIIILDGITVSTGSSTFGLVFGSSASSAITSGYNFTQTTGLTSSGTFTPSGIGNGGSTSGNFPLTTGSGLVGGGVPAYPLSGWIEVVVSTPFGAPNPTFQIYGKTTFVSSTSPSVAYTTVMLNGVLPNVSVTTPYFGLYTSASTITGTIYVYQVT